MITAPSLNIDWRFRHLPCTFNYNIHASTPSHTAGSISALLKPFKQQPVSFSAFYQRFLLEFKTRAGISIGRD
jgi:hypothetical protein